MAPGLVLVSACSGAHVPGGQPGRVVRVHLGVVPGGLHVPVRWQYGERPALRFRSKLAYSRPVYCRGGLAQSSHAAGEDWPKAPTQRAQGTLWRRGDGNQILARWFFACYAAACVLLWPALVCYLAGRKDSRWANLGSRFVPLADWMKVALDQNETELCL
jgi:hypothetical protein